jgi:hypothetical protein
LRRVQSERENAANFPILPVGREPRLFVPWAIGVEAWGRYAVVYGTAQSCRRIAERGGFGAEEMDAFRPGWRDHVIPGSSIQDSKGKQ